MPIIFMAALSVGCSAFSVAQRSVIASGGDVMHVLTIADSADSIRLRAKSRRVGRNALGREEMAVLKRKMLATVADPLDTGVGLAAPQVGIARRIVVVQRFDREGAPFEFYIDPRIVEYSEPTVTSIEGCLSIPDVVGSIRRFAAITIVYRDEATFRRIEERIEGFTAVIFQHEIDHLDGILFIDRME